jgi:hypothetical protein
LYVPAKALFHHFGNLAVVLSLFWLFLQGIHSMDNAQILHNFVVLNVLNVRRRPVDVVAATAAAATLGEVSNPQSLTVAQVAAASLNSLKWLYLHLTLSCTFICVVYYISSWVKHIFYVSQEYHINCITSGGALSSSNGGKNEHVHSIYDSCMIFGVLLTLLSLPRFTNKGLMIPLLLFVYQLYLCLLTLLINVDACDNSEVLALHALTADDDVDGVNLLTKEIASTKQFLLRSTVTFSVLFLICILWYNLSTPNMITLQNIVRGSICSRHITNNNEIVMHSRLLVEPGAQVDEERGRLLPSRGQRDQPITYIAYGSTFMTGREAATENEGLMEVVVPNVITTADMNSTAIPVYYAYFAVISCYLVILLTDWHFLVGAGVDGTASKLVNDSVTTDIIVTPSSIVPSPWLNTITYGIFAVQLSLWIFYMICLYDSYSHRDLI